MLSALRPLPDHDHIPQAAEHNDPMELSGYDERTPPRSACYAAKRKNDLSSDVTASNSFADKPPLWVDIRQSVPPATFPTSRARPEPPRISTAWSGRREDDSYSDSDISTPQSAASGWSIPSLASTSFDSLVSASSDPLQIDSFHRLDSGVEVVFPNGILTSNENKEPDATKCGIDLPYPTPNSSRRKKAPQRSPINPNFPSSPVYCEEEDRTADIFLSTKRRYLGVFNPNAIKEVASIPKVPINHPRHAIMQEVELSDSLRLDVFAEFKKNPSKMFYWNEDLRRRETSLTAKLADQDHRESTAKATPSVRSVGAKRQNPNQNGSSPEDEQRSEEPTHQDRRPEKGNRSPVVAPKALMLAISSSTTPTSFTKSQQVKRHKSSSPPPSHTPLPCVKSIQRPVKAEPHTDIPRMGLLLGELEVDATNAPLHSEDDTKRAPTITWNKGCPIKISPEVECYALLTSHEIKLCETIRMMPKQYLYVKSVMLGNRQKFGFFKKLDAKKWFKIDVNKTGKLYDWFSALGWIIGEDDVLNM